MDAVREMNRLGILIDLSHVGLRTTMETIEVSEKPVACTHANSKGYYDVPRNKAVDAIKLLAEKDGVVGRDLHHGRSSRPARTPCWPTMSRPSTTSSKASASTTWVLGPDFTQDQPVSFWKYISAQQGTKYPASFTSPDKVWKVNDPTLYPAELQTPDDFPRAGLSPQRQGAMGRRTSPSSWAATGCACSVRSGRNSENGSRRLTNPPANLTCERRIRSHVVRSMICRQPA